MGRVTICDTGWGGRKPAPDECEQQIEKNADATKELEQKTEQKIFKPGKDRTELKDDLKILDRDVDFIKQTTKTFQLPSIRF